MDKLSSFILVFEISFYINICNVFPSRAVVKVGEPTFYNCLLNSIEKSSHL